MYTNLHNDMYYCISWIMAFFFAGLLWYILDRQYWTILYRWFYNRCHKEPIEESQVKGLIYRQKTVRKFVWAFVISTVQSLLIVWGIAISLFNPLVEFSLWLIEIPVMVAGMWVGPFVYDIWSKRSTAFTTIDNIEAGKIHPGDEITDAISESTEKVRKSLKDFTGDILASLFSFIQRFRPYGEKKSFQTQTKTAIPEEDEVDPRARIRKFTER